MLPAATPDDALTSPSAADPSVPETDGGPPHEQKGKNKKSSGEPERRCIATMETLPQSRMIRFVQSPDNEVTPDLAARLPGRGAWVRADREAVDLAAKKGAFARAFKSQVRLPHNLADGLEKLLVSRILTQLGLARRAGDLILGYEQVREAIQTARPHCLIEASDGAEDGRGSVLALLKGVHGPQTGPQDQSQKAGPGDGPDGASGLDKQFENHVLPPVVGCFSADELGMALGRGRVIHGCLKQGRFATSWTGELARLSGFRPVWLEGWAPPIGT
jgi:predicted RNA-binding protein YlxR (DUF448 family)